MNYKVFKSLWGFIYKALSDGGTSEELMYGKNLSFRITTKEGDVFSFLFVGCRPHFENGTNFGTSDQMLNVECFFNNRSIVEKVFGSTESFGIDYNTPISDISKLLNSVEIDWEENVKEWIQGKYLVSDMFERSCSIYRGKVLKAELSQLLDRGMLK